MTHGPRLLLALAAGLCACALLIACGGDASDGERARPAATVSATASASPGASPSATHDRDDERGQRATATEATPTPSRVPAATIEPAFPGLPEYTRPTALIELPGHDLFLIVLQEGRVLSIPRDGPYDDPRTVHDQRETTVCCNEEGLLSVALDPEFAANGYVYAYYSPTSPRGATRLSRFATTGEGASFAFDAASELVLLQVKQPYSNHNGGTVLFGPDGMLYLGLGDGGAADDPHGHGQNLGTHLSTIIRIDVRNAPDVIHTIGEGDTLSGIASIYGVTPDDILRANPDVAEEGWATPGQQLIIPSDKPYAIPPDNPFLDREGALPEVWAYGLRNPWRMSFDRETGLLWAGDVGQRRMEEVSVVEAGGNYGWNVMEGSRCFLPETGCDRSGLALPVWEYDHDEGCSITGGYVYRGEAIPALRGWYLFSDYCTGRITAIHAATAVAGGYVEPVVLWEGGPHSIVSFTEDAAGELYAVTFAGERFYRIVAP